jgi:hypothetical protein
MEHSALSSSERITKPDTMTSEIGGGAGVDVPLERGRSIHHSQKYFLSIHHSQKYFLSALVLSYLG